MCRGFARGRISPDSVWQNILNYNVAILVSFQSIYFHSTDFVSFEDVFFFFLQKNDPQFSSMDIFILENWQNSLKTELENSVHDRVILGLGN